MATNSTWHGFRPVDQGHHRVSHPNLHRVHAAMRKWPDGSDMFRMPVGRYSERATPSSLCAAYRWSKALLRAATAARAFTRFLRARSRMVILIPQVFVAPTPFVARILFECTLSEGYLQGPLVQCATPWDRRSERPIHAALSPSQTSGDTISHSRRAGLPG